jgi:thioredoxin 1
MPAVEDLSVEFEGKVKFYKLNTTKARRLAISQRVMGLPTILLYKDGVKVDELTKDDATKENIKEMIEKVL